MNGAGYALAASGHLRDEARDVLGAETRLVGEGDDESAGRLGDGGDANLDGGEHAAAGIGVLDDSHTSARERALDLPAVRSNNDDDRLEPGSRKRAYHASDDGGVGKGHDELRPPEPPRFAGRQDDGGGAFSES